MNMLIRCLVKVVMALTAIQRIEKEKNTTYTEIIIGDGDKWDFPARIAAG